MKFEYPLVLLAIPVLIGVLYYFTRPRLSLWSIVSFCLRCLIIISLVSVIAGLQIKAKSPNLYRVYLVDTSGSVFLDKEKISEAITKNTKQLDKDDMIAVAEFNNGIVYYVADINPSMLPAFYPSDKNVSIKFPSTNIENALDFAANQVLRPDYRKEIFLFTDGNETEGNAKKAAEKLKSEGIALYTIPIGPDKVNDIKIDRVDAPAVLSENQPFQMKCFVSTTHSTNAIVQIYRDNILLNELKDISLLASQNNQLVLSLPAQPEPISAYQVKIRADGFDEITLENNSWKAVIQKTGKPRVLYLSDSAEAAKRTIPQILKASQDFDTHLLPVSDLNNQDILSSLALYDIVIIDNLALQGELAQRQEVIKSMVSNGTGLLVVGGDKSFGLGNYQNSALEDILPVWASPQEDIALYFVMDASGSMDEIAGFGDKKKFAIAGDALIDSIPLLSAKDRFGLIAFNQGFQEIMPLQPMGKDESLVKDALDKIKPTGPTAIIPPLNRAIEILSQTTAAKKHIVLLSDGHSTTNEAMDGFNKVAGQLRQNNITISVIATGSNINEETLKALTANESAGKIYRLTGKDNAELAQNLKDDLTVTKEFYRESESLPVLTQDAEMLKGMSDIPPISGYNRTTLKPDARLIASVGKDKEPLLAQWRYGLGKVMALTTSLDTQWVGGWKDWPQISQLIVQSLRYLIPDYSQKGKVEDYSIIQISDNEIRLNMRIPNGQLKLFAQVQPIMGWGNSSELIKMPQISADEFQVVIKLPDQGEYMISVFDGTDAEKKFVLKTPVVMQYPKEWTKFTPDTVLLRNLAESTSGQFITADDFATGKFKPSPELTATKFTPVTSILIIMAILLFLFDLVVGLYGRR